MPYLIHFNGNHSSKNGQFVSGDGDKDGVIDDHHNYARNKNKGMKGDKPAKPLKVENARVSKVYKTKKGKEIAYVSPNSILRKGYWADNKTGKRLVGRTLFRSAPKELQGREFAKGLFAQSAGDLQQTERAVRYAKQYNLDMIDWG